MKKTESGKKHMTKTLLLDSSWRAEWNRFVSEAADLSPYHRFEWMEAVEAAYGHKGYPLAVEEGGVIVAVLPLVLMVHPLNNPLKKQANLVSLPFCDLGGMLGTEQHQQLLRDTALDLANRMNAQLLEIRHREGEGLGYDFDRLSEDLDGQKVSMLLQLEPSSEKQLAAFKPKLRSQINKAIKNGCTTVVGNTPKLVEDFYQVFSQNMLTLGSPVHSKALFHAICSAYGDKAVVAIIYFEGAVVAGGIVLTNGHQAAIPWASSLAEYNRLAPNMLLYWELLSHCANSGIRTFDFGRSSFGEGTFRFKKQWGAQPYFLKWDNWLDQGGSLSAPPSRLRSVIESAWRRLPLSVANFLGPLIRKHIRL
jgi:FemAB-related protein (PEP-CTERM system-associated)